MKIITVIGARPQFIKASVFSSLVKNDPHVSEKIIHTGQHFDTNMSEVFFDSLNIPTPQFQLHIQSASHGEMTGRMITEIESILMAEKPQAVLVYGDTNSTLAGALAAAKLHIPVAHVEAGLRSYNKKMPEEINRILTDHCSSVLLTPTDRASQNLVKEGFATETIVQIGDVMLDASLLHSRSADQHSKILTENGLSPQGYILATCHRAESTSSLEILKAIFMGLFKASSTLPVICPLHPRTRGVLQQQDWFKNKPSTFLAVDPVGYFDMLKLEKNAALIATDSGGVQKEAFFFSVPCVTLRSETEWSELIDLGWNRLAPLTSAEEVQTSVLAALGTQGQKATPYGHGTAAEKIKSELLARFSSGL